MISLTARLAAAQSAEAEQLFRDGDKLMKAGKTEEACTAFEGSNRIEPRAGTLIRLGDCRLAREQFASAWSAYTDALARAKDPKKKKLAQQGIAKTEGRLSRLTITVSSPDVALRRNGEAVDSALWNRPIPVDGGHYEIAIAAEGYLPTTITVDVPPEGGNVTIDVPVLQRAPTPIAPPVQQAPVVVTRPPASMWTTPRRVAIGTAGVSVLAVGAGVLFGIQASSRESDALARCNQLASCPDHVAANALMEEARSRALLANVMFGVAGAAAIGTVALWFLGAPSDEVVVPTVSADGAGVSYVGRF